MGKRVITLGVAFLVGILFYSSPVSAKDQLTLWVHPYLPATKLLKKFSPLAEYLSRECDLDITVKVAKDYKRHIDKVGRDQADLAYMGPAPYVKMTEQYGVKPLLAGLEVNGAPFYSGMIIVRKGSAIKKLEDLRGKKFAFGDPSSTMNHLVPHYMLHQAGIADDDLAEIAFLGSHSNIALGVLGGYYDAGGVKEAIFYQYEKRGLSKLAQSMPIPEHLFVASTTLPKPVTEKIRRALLELQDQKVLTSLKKTVTGMAPVVDTDFDGFRQILEECDQHDAF